MTHPSVPLKNKNNKINKNNLPLYITVRLTTATLLLCTIFTTLQCWTMSNTPTISAPHGEINENYTLEIDENDMAAILAEPLRMSNEDEETVSARNQERTTREPTQDESLSRFVLQQQQQRRRDAAKLQKLANDDAKRAEEKTKADTKLKQEQHDADALRKEKEKKKKKKQKQKQEKEKKEKKEKKENKENKENKEKKRKAKQKFRTGRKTPTPAGFRQHHRNSVPCASFKDYEAQRQCLVQKYKHCVAQKDGFCSHSDLQRALQDLEPFPVGSRVKTKWRDGYERVVGSVERVHKDGTYDVTFDPPLDPNLKWKNVPAGKRNVPASDMEKVEDKEEGRSKARENKKQKNKKKKKKTRTQGKRRSTPDKSTAALFDELFK